MRLHELQRAFQARVLSSTHGIEPELNGTNDGDFDSRLDAYVGGYRERLIEALAATYPVLQSTLGESEFSQLMRSYIEECPSHYFSIRDYGSGIDRHLVSSYAADPRGTALCELARWEWLLAAVFDAPDDLPLEVAGIAGFAPQVWPQLTFRFRRCVKRCHTSSNIVQWWRAANGLCDRPLELADAETAQWIVWRRGIKTLFRSVDPLEAEILDAALVGETFGDLCERMAHRVDASEVAIRAASLLRGWVIEELLAECAAPTVSE